MSDSFPLTVKRVAEARIDEVIARQIGAFGCSTGSLRYDISMKNLLAKIMKYLHKHAEATSSEDEIKAWDADFINKLDPDTLSDLYREEKILEIKSLLDLTSQALSDRKNKSPEEVRNTNREEEEDDPNGYMIEAVRIVAKTRRELEENDTHESPMDTTSNDNELQVAKRPKRNIRRPAIY